MFLVLAQTPKVYVYVRVWLIWAVAAGTPPVLGPAIQVYKAVRTEIRHNIYPFAHYAREGEK